MNIVFQYLLLLEQPFFVYSDKSLRESKKSSVIHFLKEKIYYSSPSNVNTVIADEIFVARSSLKEKTSAFASFVTYIAIKLLKLINHCLDLWLDINESPSIRDIKRKSRSVRDVKSIFGPRQSLPTNFLELLNTSDFKTEFLCFLFKEYEDQIYGPIIVEKVFYCSVDNTCKRVY